MHPSFQCVTIKNVNKKNAKTTVKRFRASKIFFWWIIYFILNMVKTLILQVTITVFHFNI